MLAPVLSWGGVDARFSSQHRSFFSLLCGHGDARRSAGGWVSGGFGVASFDASSASRVTLVMLLRCRDALGRVFCLASRTAQRDAATRCDSESLLRLLLGCRCMVGVAGSISHLPHLCTSCITCSSSFERTGSCVRAAAAHSCSCSPFACVISSSACQFKRSLTYCSAARLRHVVNLGP